MDTTINENLLRDYEYVKLKRGIIEVSAVTPKWVDPHDPWQKEVPSKHLEIIEGDAEITELFRNSIIHKYFVKVNQPTLFKENTYYFPGWKLRVNSKENDILNNDTSYPGIILFQLEKGINIVELEYTNTSVKTLSFLLSIITLSILGLLLIANQFKGKQTY
jgi:hypothetical protein